MNRLAWTCVAVILTGCASSGIVPTGRDTFMVTKKGAGGAFTPGEQVKADLYIEANAHCAKTGQVVETIEATSENGIPFARMPSASITFRCAPR